MRVENGQIAEDVTINDGLKLHGQITGRTFVERGGELHLYGMCANGLTIKAGGKVLLYGTVNGKVLNEGGDLEIFGMVNGHVQTISGNTIIGPDAVVSGGSA